MTEYTVVKLPVKITNAIEQVLENNPELLYRSRNEFIMDSIRRRLLQVRK